MKSQKRRKKQKKSKVIKPSLRSRKKVNTDHYWNREDQWLAFNDRVLWQATDREKPLLERLRFCDIFISNLDEFYMKRVGGLINQRDSIHTFTSFDGRNPAEQIALIREKVIKQTKDLKSIVENKLLPALSSEGIKIVKWNDLSSDQHLYLREYFHNNIFPVLTPLAVDYVHPFPFISNLSKSLAISLREPKTGERIFARVKIPQKIKQWLSIPIEAEGYLLINCEELIINCLDELYTGMQIDAASIFRVTRHAGLEDDDGDADDLLEHVEEGLKERKFSPVLRLEIEKDADPWLKKYLIDELDLGHDDVYEIESLSNFTNFSEIIEIVERKDLKYIPWVPKTKYQFLDDNISIFNVLKRREVLVHHPYESFNTSVERFIQSAVDDPKVLAIKLTLYRTDQNSQIIHNLIDAAEKGKQVACVVELKARFDEESNIRWAEKMENAGVHVVFGMAGLKTHSKMAMIVRDEGREIKTYVHIGTGNYNSSTSKIYTDLSFFTTRKSVTNEVIEVFNYLTGYSLKTNYKKLLVAPVSMKSKFLSLINQEIKNKNEGKPALIVAKMNQLEDIDIIEKLYAASQAGVEVLLHIRGFCCLKAGVKGLSENIKVSSYIGRFLEHSRIFYFANGSSLPEEGKFYIGSADWMYRNLNSRVEVIAPIESKELRLELWDILQIEERDNSLSWDMKPDGQYQKREQKGKKICLHNYLMEKSIRENEFNRGLV